MIANMMQPHSPTDHIESICLSAKNPTLSLEFDTEVYVLRVIVSTPHHAKCCFAEALFTKGTTNHELQHDSLDHNLYCPGAALVPLTMY